MKKAVKGKNAPLVAVVMGSKSDWETMEATVMVLKDFGIPYTARVVSAHRTPSLLEKFAKESEEIGIKVIIAGAGGAAHLPGMLAAFSTLPVLGVPVESRVLKGMDSLLSIVQMPAGIPVGTLAIGKAGATNAGLLAVSILANSDSGVKKKLVQFRANQTAKVLKEGKLDG